MPDAYHTTRHRPMRRTALRNACGAFLAAIAMSGCGMQSTEAAPNDGWVRECPRDAFCFSRPPTLVARPVQAIDSLVGQYRGDAVTMTFDLGQYGTSVAHLSQAVQVPAIVDGKPARIYFAEREIVLIIPKVRESGPFTIRFSMTLKFDGNASRALAERIFQSIEFKPAR